MKLTNYLVDRFLCNSKITLIDCGALDGVKSPWSKIEKYIQVIGFEPQIINSNLEGSKRTVTKSTQQLFLDPVGLSSRKAEQVPFYITKHADNSSLLKPNKKIIDQFYFRDHFQIISEELINVDTLDHQLSKKKIDFVDFLKLDTQGSELDILLGAEAILKQSVLGVEVEVNFIERYQGQNFFSDIDILLRKKNFEIIDFERRFGKRNNVTFFDCNKGQLTHGTALYMRTPEAVLALTSQFKREKKVSVLFHYILIFILYGYVDIAKQYFNLFQLEFQKEEKESIEYFLLQVHTREYRPFGQKGSYKVYAFFSYLAGLFKPYGTSGVSGDKKLGN